MQLFIRQTQILLLLCLVFFTIKSSAQCPLGSANIVSNPFSDGENNPVADASQLTSDCTDRIQTTFEVFSGNGYEINLTEGETYVIGSCEDNDNWDLTITVYDSAGNEIAYDDGDSADCPNGSMVTLTANGNQPYTIITSTPDCMSNSVPNGRIYIYNNTDGVSECPITSANCVPSITTNYDALSTSGSGSSNDPYVFCAQNGLNLSSVINGPSDYFVPDENDTAGAVIFVLYLDQPTSENPFETFDGNFTTVALSDMDNTIIYDNGTVNFSLLVDENDPNSFFQYGTPYVIVPFLVPNEGVSAPQLSPLCVNDSLTLVTYPYISFAQPIDEEGNCVECETEGGDLSLDDGSTSLTLCVSDTDDDMFEVSVVNNMGTNYGYIITNENDSILSPLLTDNNITIAADTPAGTCKVYGVAYDTAPNLPEFIGDISGGCAVLSSNFIEVVRVAVDGGNLALNDGSTEISICSNFNEESVIDVVVNGNMGSNYQYFITDDAGNVLGDGLQSSATFDLTGAPTGICLIYGIASEGSVTLGATMSDISGDCFSVSENSISVTRTNVNAGTVALADGGDAISVCGDDAVADTLDLVANGASDFDELLFFLADDAGNIVSELQSDASFVIDDLDGGTYQVLAVAHTGTLTSGATINDFTGDCFGVSGAGVSVEVLTGDDCPSSCDNSDLMIDVVVSEDCNFGGQINFTVSGGVGEITLDHDFFYSELVFDNGGGNYTAILSFEENYAITATDSLGCTFTYLGSNECPESCVDDVAQITCNQDENGFNDGTATLFVPIPQDIGVFYINNSNQDGDVLNDGDPFNVEVLLEFGCHITSSGVVDCPIDTLNPCLDFGINVDVMCNGDGTGVLTYIVLGDSTPIDTTGTPYATLLNHGDPYEITVTDDLGCEATISGMLDCPNPCDTSSLTITPNIVCNNNGTATLNYEITGGVGEIVVTGNENGEILSNSAFYQIMATDSLGCTAEITDGIIDCPDDPCNDLDWEIITNIICDENGGTGVLNFEIIGNIVTTDSTGTDLGAILNDGDTYEVTVTDENGCIQTQSGIVDCPIFDPCNESDLMIENIEISCNNDGTGTLTYEVSGGMGEILIEGTESSEILNNGDTYEITATDSLGCSVTVNGEVGENECTDCTNFEISNVETTCNGDGTATLTYEILVTDDITVTILGNENGDILNNGDTYEVTAITSDGCTAMISGEVGENECADCTTLNITNIEISCNGDGTGTLTYEIEGANTDFTISGTENGAILENGASYEVTVTTEDDCTTTISGTLAEDECDETPDPLSVTTEPICNEDEDAFVVEVTIMGGTAPYQVTGTMEIEELNDNFFTTGEIVAGSSYSFVVIDANGEIVEIISEPVSCKPGCELGIFGFSNECIDDQMMYNAELVLTSGTAPYNYTVMVDGEIFEEGSSVLEVISFENVPNGIVSIQVTDAQDCVVNDEYSIFCEPATDLELIDFYGKTEQNGNRIIWQTATETNTHHFELQRSTKNQHFEQITTLVAAGNSNTIKNYQFLDEKALSGIAYYRLITHDMDGTQHISRTIALTRMGEFEVVEIYPVPVTDQLTIVLNTETTSTQVQLFDLTGKLVKTQQINTQVGTNQIELNVSELTVGVYFLNVTDGDDIITRKVVKE